MTRRPPIWAFVAAAWLGPATLAALREFLQSRFNDAAVQWRAIAFEFGDWFLYALFTPVIFALARRYPLERGTLVRRVPLHLLGALGFCVLWAGLGVLYGSALHGEYWTPYGMGAVNWLLGSLPFGVAVYFGVLGVEHATFYFLEARERETQAARLQAQLAEARLGALRMQLQPHFLFNSLNAITVIVRDRDTATATRMLEHLGDMLRRVMRADRPQEVTLAEELDFVRQYLAIEQVRFSDRFQPVFAVDDAVLAAAVPEFLLQPLVENALRHGLAKRVTATLLRIEARREGDDLVLSVIDDGPGPGGAPADLAEGVGPGNTRERLATLYGARGRLELESLPGGGARVTVRIPYRVLERPGG